MAPKKSSGHTVVHMEFPPRGEGRIETQEPSRALPTRAHHPTTKRDAPTDGRTMGYPSDWAGTTTCHRGIGEALSLCPGKGLLVLPLKSRGNQTCPS